MGLARKCTATAMAFAVTLCMVLGGCAGGVHDDAGGSPGAANSEQGALHAEEFDQFVALMEGQQKTYAFNYLEEYTLGEGVDAVKGTTCFSAKVDDSGTAERMYRMYGEEDDEAAGVEMYFNGDTVIEVNDVATTDVSASYSANEESVEVLDGTWLGFTFDPAALIQVTNEGDDTLYRFAFPAGIESGLGAVDEVTQGQSVYRFDAAGTLLEVQIEVKGESSSEGVGIPASAVITETYSDWGQVEVPAAPEPNAKLVLRDVTEVSNELRERLENLPANMTVQTETDMTVLAEGQEQATEIYAETLIDRTDGFKCGTYVEIDGNEDEAVLTLYDGDQSAVIRNGEVVGEAQTAAPEDPAGTEKALAILACARSVDTYEYDDGSVEYVATIDAGQVSGQALFDGVEKVKSLSVSYYFGPEGEIQSVAMNIAGVPSDAAEGASITVETNAFYSELGTTEVPSIP